MSGGGSSLLPIPPNKIDLAEIQSVNNSLLKCGATVEEINIIRKHISQIKGGRLVKYAYPATIVCLIISDVVGDNLSSIASGPTVPDPSTYSDAIGILKRYNVWNTIPESVKRHLTNGLKGKIPESYLAHSGEHLPIYPVRSNTVRAAQKQLPESTPFDFSAYLEDPLPYHIEIVILKEGHNLTKLT